MSSASRTPDGRSARKEHDMGEIRIEPELCRNCGICSEVCPNSVLTRDQSNRIALNRQAADLCFECLQCMAICPSKAITVNGKSYDKDLFEIDGESDIKHDFLSLISTRRSIRNFKNQSVTHEHLREILEAVAFAPPSFPPIRYKIKVIENRDMIKRALPYMIDLYEFLLKANRNPVKNHYIRKELGKKKYKKLEGHLVPRLELRLPNLKNGIEDTITRNAQALILFVEDTEGDDLCEDIYIACTYAMLAAHSIGVGATMMDIIPPAINKKKELKALFNIREGEQVTASLILGYPKYAYPRGIRRRIGSIEWI